MQETLHDFDAPGLSADASALLKCASASTPASLCRTIAGTDHTAMGDVVNTAARLQTLAPPGGVLVARRRMGSRLEHHL